MKDRVDAREVGDVPRGLKLGLGIVLAIIGVVLTVAGLALLAVVGADGRYTSPELEATSDGHALLFDAIFVEGDLPISGTFATTLGADVTSDRGPLFIGIAPTEDVARYLAGVPVDQVTELNVTGGELTTRSIAGDRTPEPPAGQPFWVARAGGAGTESIEWTLDRGEWTFVVMNADASAGLDVHGTATVELPALGAATIVVLVLGIPALVAGILLIVSALRSKPDDHRRVPPRPDSPRLA
jgi:hypothetical protein